jgi:hypothetical protein
VIPLLYVLAGLAASLAVVIPLKLALDRRTRRLRGARVEARFARHVAEADRDHEAAQRLLAAHAADAERGHGYRRASRGGAA